RPRPVVPDPRRPAACPRPGHASCGRTCVPGPTRRDSKTRHRAFNRDPGRAGAAGRAVPVAAGRGRVPGRSAAFVPTLLLLDVRERRVARAGGDGVAGPPPERDGEALLPPA